MSQNQTDKHSTPTSPKNVSIYLQANLDPDADLEFYDMLYMFRLKKSAEHFFDQKVQARRKQEEELALKQERQLILKKFFDEFDVKRQCREQLDDSNGTTLVKIYKPVTDQFLQRLKQQKAVLESIAFNQIPGVT